MLYGLDRAPVPAVTSTGDVQLDRLFAELSGASFGGGLYRVHTPEASDVWTKAAAQMFVSFSDRLVCFASDWLGRQFALDRRRQQDGHHLVLLLEPGNGEALEIPASVKSLHTDELVNHGDAALALSFYADWREATGDDDYLEPDQCVGYDVPLFLGGDDDLTNLSRIDMDVYWSVVAGLRSGALDLPPGTKINEVRLDS